MGQRICSVEACEKPAKPGYVEPVCPMHRERMRLHGSYESNRKPPAPRLILHGYVMLYLPEHPLASRDGRVGEHRAVLFKEIGPGKHLCHWCKATVTWDLGRNQRGALYVDHLDGDPSNNVPSNLVPSCNSCNINRPHVSKAHCKHGHEYTPENTIIRKGGRRTCRECNRIRLRRRRVEKGY